MISAGTLPSEISVEVTAKEAREKFGLIVSALNQQVAGRSLFAGTGVNGPALADAENIISKLAVATAGESTASGVANIVNDWFDAPGGGFETDAYLGETQDLSAIRIGANSSANLNLRADDQSVRNILKGYALAALIDQGILNSVQEERGALLARAGSELLSAQPDFSKIRADLGNVESLVEHALVRNTAEVQALEIVKGRVLEIDPNQTATELQAAETRLETLYAITARLSRLSLVDYL